MKKALCCMLASMLLLTACASNELPKEDTASEMDIISSTENQDVAEIEVTSVSKDEITSSITNEVPDTAQAEEVFTAVLDEYPDITIQTESEEALTAFLEMWNEKKTAEEAVATEPNMTANDDIDKETNAFEKFQKAQEIDYNTDYESIMKKMIASVGDGFDTGKVGTETFNAAIKGIWAPEIYGDLTNPEDLDHVWAEFIGDAGATTQFNKFYTYSTNNGYQITLDNLKNFVEACQKKGLMTGTSFDEFDIVENVCLQDFEDGLGISKEAAFAYLDILSNYTIGGVNLLGDSTPNYESEQ